MSRLRNFNPYEYLKKKNISNGIWIVFVLLSVLMRFFAGKFSLKGWIQSPQFTDENVTTTWFETTVENTNQLTYFITFFILDFLWAFLLLLLLSHYVYKKATLHTQKPRWFYWSFLIICVITYILDCIENISYLNTYEYPEIATYKVIAYGITFVYFIVVVMYYSLKDRLSLIRDFVSSAWISLVFLVLIGLTLPKAPQLNSIIVDLYYHPFWFVIILLGLFAPFYCIALSHYPTYFLLSKNSKRIGKKKWRIENPVGLFGIIWHSSDSKREKIERGENFIYESDLGFLRRTIGIFFYMALFYMIAYTTDTNFDTNLSGATVFFLVISLWWLYKINKKKNAWYIHCKSNITPINYDYLNDDEKKYGLHVEIWTFIIAFSVMVAAHFALFILLIMFDSGDQSPYTMITVLLSLACILLQTLTYMYYRTFRSVLKYAFFKDTDIILESFIITRDKNTKDPEVKKDEIRAKFKDNEEIAENKKRSPIFQIVAKTHIASFSNNVIFLKVTAYLGMINAAFLVWINIFPTDALAVNSIIIILSYFFLFYGMIVIILKHFLYYKSEAEEIIQKEQRLTRKIDKAEAALADEVAEITDDSEKTIRTKIITDHLEKLKAELKGVIQTKKEEKPIKKQHHFTFTIYVSVLVLAIFNYLARFNESTSNNLYELAQIPETVTDDTAVHLDAFVKKLPNTRYYIGCYGGGMKANAWTMTVLNALDKNNTLYDKTACLSGASGGTIGLINYSVIKHNIENPDLKKEAIRNIGTENILSMDLTHVFGRDLLNHVLVPITDLKGKDRSTGAMKRYAMYADADYYYYADTILKEDRTGYEFDIHKFNNTSYRQYWQNMYSKRPKGFPILISNTTDIKGKQGMAVSIKTKNKTAQDILYAGACDILDLGKNTLSFYNAASTTNRFPLISPAATIEGKGQFNDGGIFENSGLLSALKLYEAIHEVDSTAKEKTSVFINIINDKAAYVKWRIASVMNYCKGDKMNASNEISAILNSVAATEMFPTYVKDKLKLLDRLNGNICFKNIYLPHRFYFEDVKAIYGEDIKDLVCVDVIHDIITQNNTEISELVKKYQPSKTSAIIEPEMSRVMAIPAFEFMEQMLEHSSIRQTIIDLRE